MSTLTWTSTTGNRQPALGMSAGSAVSALGYGSAVAAMPCAAPVFGATSDVMSSARVRGTDVAIVKAFPGSHAWSPPT